MKKTNTTKETLKKIGINAVVGAVTGLVTYTATQVLISIFCSSEEEVE